MNGTLIKALAVLAAASVIFSLSAASFYKGRSVPSLLQALGGGFLIVVALVHVCEALHLFPSMHWGEKQSIGHYLDLLSATLAIILLASGYALAVRERRRSPLPDGAGGA
jgi:hypothetical protein